MEERRTPGFNYPATQQVMEQEVMIGTQKGKSWEAKDRQNNLRNAGQK